MARMRLGEFDPNPYKSLTMDNVYSDVHKQLAVRIADCSIGYLNVSSGIVQVLANPALQSLKNYSKTTDSS